MKLITSLEGIRKNKELNKEFQENFESTFANAEKSPYIKTEGMPQPEGEIYKD